MSKKSKPGDGSFMKGTKGAALYGAHFTEAGNNSRPLTGAVKSIVRLMNLGRS